MSGTDLVFYTLAIAAAAAAALSALRPDIARAARAAVGLGAAIAGLLALLELPLPACALTVCVAVAHATLKRAGVASEFRDDAATVTSRLRCVALVAAFLALLLRTVLMARWPLAAGAAHSSVSLVHHLVVALLLVGIGLVAAMSRRSIAGVGLGMLTVLSGVVLALGASAHFVPGSGAAERLAALAILGGAASTAASVRIAASAGELVRSSEIAWQVAGTISTALAGVTLALLVTAW